MRHLCTQVDLFANLKRFSVCQIDASQRPESLAVCRRIVMRWKNRIQIYANHIENPLMSFRTSLSLLCIPFPNPFTVTSKRNRPFQPYRLDRGYSCISNTSSATEYVRSIKGIYWIKDVGNRFDNHNWNGDDYAESGCALFIILFCFHFDGFVILINYNGPNSVVWFPQHRKSIKLREQRRNQYSTMCM